jgi:hypothetical protein
MFLSTLVSEIRIQYTEFFGKFLIQHLQFDKRLKFLSEFFKFPQGKERLYFVETLVRFAQEKLAPYDLSNIFGSRFSSTS